MIYYSRPLWKTIHEWYVASCHGWVGLEQCNLSSYASFTQYRLFPIALRSSMCWQQFTVSPASSEWHLRVFSSLFRHLYINVNFIPYLIFHLYSNVTTSTTRNIFYQCTYVHLCLFHSKRIQYSTNVLYRSKPLTKIVFIISVYR